MGEYNHRAFTKSPQVKFTRKGEKDIPGTWFVGFKRDERDIDDHLTIFDFELVSAHPDLFTGTKDKNTPWVASEVGNGDLVSWLGGSNEKGQISQLTDKLQQVPKDQKIRVTFLGKVLNESTGREYNDYKVEDAE